MYAYVDRPVSALSAGSRLLLWATRGWSHARANGTCPPGAIAPAFLHCGAIAALPELHRLLMLLEAGDSDRLGMAPLGAATINDMEAVLVQLFVDALTRPYRARATLTLLLQDAPDGLDAGFKALGAVVTCLLGKGLAPDGLAEARAARA